MDIIADPNAATPAAAELIKDGTSRSFMQDVVNASRDVPVLVDFWATWCGPCKTLTPALEKVVKAAQGRIRLVKIDIDQNQALVQQLSQMGLPLQSVPTVVAFWQGQIADLFQGALPESEIKRFVDTLLKQAGGQMPAADLLAEAKAAMEQGDHAAAVEIFGGLTEQEPENPEAFAGLMRALMALDEEEQALEVLATVPEKIRDHADIAGVRSALELAAEGRAAKARLSEFQERLAADPDDHAAALELAVALNASEDRAGAAQVLLDAIKRDRAWNEEAARKQLLKFFEAWGPMDPATIKARRGLSTLLFR